MSNIENEAIEIDLLLEAIFRKYGYDFRNYARASIERRLRRRLALSGLESIAEMIHQVLDDLAFFETLLRDCSINVTEMFRDPPFYQAFRKEVIPYLKTFPFFRIWIPGYATGEEVYSMAILLEEEGLHDRVQIYATDFNSNVIEKAKEGIYSLQTIKDYTANYQKAGGSKSFSDYYTAHYDAAILHPFLKSNIVFAAHNLVTDGVFNEMHMISCRNVFIYFNRELQNRVVKLFIESFHRGGFLCLGTKESLQFSDYARDFDEIVKKEKSIE